MSLTIDEALQQGIAAQQAGDLPAAERLYRAILAANPRHPEANHHLGVLAASVRQYVAALPFLKAALEASPGKIQHWVSYVDTLVKASQVPTARQVLQQGRHMGLAGPPVDDLDRRVALAERFSESAGRLLPHMAQALALRDAGKYGEALQALQAWLAAQPADADAWALLAHVLLLAGHEKEARTAWGRAHAIRPDLPVVLRGQARLLLRSGGVQEAMAAARMAYEASTDDPESWLVLAAAHLANQQAGEAGALVDALLALRPEYAEALAIRAHVRAGAGDMQGAMADAQLALSVKPYLGQLWAFLANAKYRSGDLPGAASAMREACRSEPNNVSYGLFLSEYLRLDKKLEDALVVLDALVLQVPEHAGAWTNKGTVLQGLGRDAEAQAAYEQALRIQPAAAEVINNIGILRHKAGDWRDAIAFFDRALGLNARLAKAHANKAAALKELGLLDEAVASCRQALELDAGSADDYTTLVNLAGMLQLQGKVGEATSVLVRISELNPDAPAVLFNKAEDAYFADDLDTARELYSKVKKADPSKLGMPASLALAAMDYVEGHVFECRQGVEFASKIYDERGAEFKGWRAYWIYLMLLLGWREKNDVHGRCEGATVYVVGESHTIAAHGVVVDLDGGRARCEAKWIRGCKQWHLGGGNVPMFKEKFESVVSKIPRGSNVLLMIGEIDCRQDEGIIRFVQKHPGNTLADVALLTISRYLDYVSATLGRFGHRILVCGIPCPNAEMLRASPVELQELVGLVRLFNQILKRETLTRGMDFIDVHALTDDGQGISSQLWHLDAHHLFPSATVAAFKHHFHPARGENA